MYGIYLMMKEMVADLMYTLSSCSKISNDDQTSMMREYIMSKFLSGCETETHIWKYGLE